MKKFSVIILCLALALSFCSCASKTANDMAMGGITESAVDTYSEFGYSMDMSATADEEKPAQGTAQQNEKIIKTVELYAQTKEYKAYVDGINASVVALGGYVESSSTDLGNGSETYNRNARLVVRIPAEKLDEFLAKAGENGKITSINEQQQNVTLEYVDLESRISAFKTERDTLTKLLEEAASLENVLAIQERLSEVNYEIENYSAQMRVLENRVGYSTVTMNIREVERVTENEPSLWSEIKDRFADNLDEVGNTLRNIVIDIIGGIPVLVPLAAIAAAAIIIIRKIIKKRKAKRNII